MTDHRYAVAHNRVRRWYGPAKFHECLLCGCTAKDWALWHMASEVLRDDRGIAYSDSPTDYVAMCRLCHKAYDAAQRKDPEGFPARFPDMARQAWESVPADKRERDARHRADQRRLFLMAHYPKLGGTA